uniref:OsmC family peroxiredoxin n=1 Tax=candidate division WOR-3 bacterium TaxID=2052148 RepID=A0A7C2K2F6_UNCW3
MKVNLKWEEELKFKAETPSGHHLYLDSAHGGEGESAGPTPMELLLVALAGCTAMDVISILKKMRENVREFSVEVEGERAPEHPKYYTKIHIKYIFKGENLKEENLLKAIQLSQNKYCSVSANLKGKSEITFSYEVKD